MKDLLFVLVLFIAFFTTGELLREYHVTKQEKVDLQLQMDSIEDLKDSLENKIFILGDSVDSLHRVIDIQDIIIGVTATMYHPTRDQCDDTPNITADGSIFDIHRASSYKWIAVSRDLLYYNGGPLKYNDYVAVIHEGKMIGQYKVKDTMNKRWISRIDFLESPGTLPYKYENVTLVKL